MALSRIDSGDNRKNRVLSAAGKVLYSLGKNHSHQLHVNLQSR